MLNYFGSISGVNFYCSWAKVEILNYLSLSWVVLQGYLLDWENIVFLLNPILVSMNKLIFHISSCFWFLTPASCLTPVEDMICYFFL